MPTDLLAMEWVKSDADCTINIGNPVIQQFDPMCGERQAICLAGGSQCLRPDEAVSRGLTYGASNIISTTGDMLKLDQALTDGRLLKPETLDMAYTPATLADGKPDFVWKNLGGMGDADDGLGWFIFRDRSMGKIVWHTGGMQGCATLFMRNLTKHQTVIVFDNTSSENLYKKGLSAMRLLNGLPALPIRKSLMKVYARALMDEGADTAFARLESLKDDTEHFALAEDDLNNLGYQFIEQGHPSQALETFRTAIGLYPSSDNLYESYAEMLEKNQQPAVALLMYRRALALNAGNTDARDGMRKLEGRISKEQ